MIKLPMSDAARVLWHVMSRKLVPMLTSSPGVGKSSIGRQMAAVKNLKVFDIRLSQADPTDMNGFPFILECKTKAGYVPMETFPMEDDPLPTEIRVDSEGNEYVHTFDGWLLLFDEMNSATTSVQAAAYKVVLEKEVGLRKMHDKVYMLAAGNLATDGAIVNKLGTAMQSRLIHFELELDVEAWCSWARKADIDFRIIAYINYKQDMLMNFSPNHNDCTFACPRTWEFLSILVHDNPKLTLADLPMICGTVGEGVGREFLGFCEIFHTLPSIETIIQFPDTYPVPIESSSMYAISGLISKHINEDNIAVLIKAISRLPLEFQVITLMDTITQNPNYILINEVRQWATKHGKHFID